MRRPSFAGFVHGLFYLVMACVAIAVPAWLMDINKLTALSVFNCALYSFIATLLIRRWLSIWTKYGLLPEEDEA